jgi:hypothetical protein
MSSCTRDIPYLLYITLARNDGLLFAGFQYDDFLLLLSEHAFATPHIRFLLDSLDGSRPGLTYALNRSLRISPEFHQQSPGNGARPAITAKTMNHDQTTRQ